MTSPIFNFSTFPSLKIATIVPLVIIQVIPSNFMILIIVLHLLVFPNYEYYCTVLRLYSCSSNYLRTYFKLSNYNCLSKFYFLEISYSTSCIKFWHSKSFLRKISIFLLDLSWFFTDSLVIETCFFSMSYFL